MAITQYRPTGLASSLFDEFFSPWIGGGTRMHSLLQAPEAEVVETEADIRVLMDAPGMAPDDIDINLENNILTVSGERRPAWTEVEERNLTWHLSERRYGKFSRSFVLPRDVEQDRIAAHFENGVLSITIPKTERARRRRIEIQSGGGQSGRVEATTGAGA
jgi:HSP20 family protein